MLKVALINIVAILMMPVKLSTLGLLEIKVFWDKDCNIIIFVQEVTNKNLLLQILLWIWSFNQSLVTDRNSWFIFNDLGLALDVSMKFYVSGEKGLG